MDHNPDSFIWFAQNFKDRVDDTWIQERLALVGDISLIEWYYKNIRDWFPNEMVHAAAGNGNLEVLQWIAERDPHFAKSTAKFAAGRNGRYDVLDWLLAL